MFEQSPTAGPGMATVTQHSAEILLLLGGAFLLGLLLHWLLSRRTVQLLRQTTTELTRTKERLIAAERRPAPTARLRESNSTEHERTLERITPAGDGDGGLRLRRGARGPHGLLRDNPHARGRVPLPDQGL